MSAKIAKILLDKKAVTIRTDPPYIWASGIQSPIYCDNRLLLSHPDARTGVINAFLKLIRKNQLKPQAIAGTATAGIPWGALLAERLKLPFLYVRTKAKSHGKGNQIEGKLKKKQKVLLVEDLISTGGSSLDCAKAIKRSGGEVLSIIAIFTYKLTQSKENFKKAKLPLLTLTDFPVLIDVAVKRKYLSPKKKAAVLAWSEDTSSWGHTNRLN